MVSLLLLVLLIPSALAIAGRQNRTCTCERYENEVVWRDVQPSTLIQQLCEEGSGRTQFCSEKGFATVCIGSVDRESCDCMVDAAKRWEREKGPSSWTLVSTLADPSMPCPHPLRCPLDLGNGKRRI
ncbi:uncharacterized protein B0H64DRAFT_388951 [Chaetomium fimeti]|uniref:Uncharacterized protein n=1 Tax=Chaetomium fimeti TaxID=1854472 RepID=A0AAE0HN79_9PEZI|nr:hypothetical protein B0H64DRAFT_388951 [Chaetomium fimeti]